RWVWQSIRPGVIQRPSQSTVSAPESTSGGRSAAGPANRMRPSRAATAPSSTMPNPGRAGSSVASRALLQMRSSFAMDDLPDTLSRGALPRRCLAVMYILNRKRRKPKSRIRGRSAAAGRVFMTVIHAENALLPEGLARDVRLVLSDGKIESVETNAAPRAGDERHRFVLPAMPNLHSHAFQRAMAGLAETRGPGEDSFWSWRTEMYRVALSMTPEQVEAVAAQLYMEMLEAGFCRVGEFHYLHHDKDGAHYADPAEMAARIAAASAEAGIALTLLPVFYAHSGFGGAAPIEGQRRFIHDVDAFARLMERAGAIVS